MTTTYEIHRYHDAKVVGEIELTDRQYAEFQSECQQPEGLIRLGAICNEYTLADEFQDTHEDTTVYID